MRADGALEWGKGDGAGSKTGGNLWFIIYAEKFIAQKGFSTVSAAIETS